MTLEKTLLLLQRKFYLQNKLLAFFSEGEKSGIICATYFASPQWHRNGEFGLPPFT